MRHHLPKKAFASIISYLVFAIGLIAPNQMTAGELKHEYRMHIARKVADIMIQMNLSAKEGFRVAFLETGDTQTIGQFVAVMGRDAGVAPKPQYDYELLPMGRLAPGEKALNQLAGKGFQYRGLSRYDNDKFVLLERDSSQPMVDSEYKVVGTNRMATMREELEAAAGIGFRLLGVQAVPGAGPVAILSRPKGAAKRRFSYRIVSVLPATVDDGYVIRHIIDGYPGENYVLELDLSSPLEAIEYQMVPHSSSQHDAKSLQDTLARLMQVQQDGFRFSVSSSNVFVVERRRGWKPAVGLEHVYLKDPDYFIVGPYYISNKNPCPFEQELTRKSAEGYDLVAFYPMYGVMIKPRAQ